MVKQSKYSTGFGHQYRIEEKSMYSCKQYIEKAMMELLDRKNDNPDVQALFEKLSDCFTKAHELEYAASEKYNLND